ncbi:MAG: type II secretion system protein GspC [Kofleriaceae bacterium]
MSEVPSRAPIIAIGAAIAALVISLTAVIVVATREHSNGIRETTIPAADLAKLDRKAFETVGSGVRVGDAKLRDSLGLDGDVVISAVSGKTVTTEVEAAAAVRGALALGVSRIYVDVVRDGEPAVVRWRVDRSASLAVKADPPATTPSGDPLLATITRIDDYRFEIPRSTVERIMANPDDHMKSARVVPSIKNGVAEGFKLYAIRPSSLWKAIGLENGDTIRAINGLELTSLDRALEVYTRLKDAKELAIDITRRGKLELITLTIK